MRVNIRPVATNRALRQLMLAGLSVVVAACDGGGAGMGGAGGVSAGGSGGGMSTGGSGGGMSTGGSGGGMSTGGSGVGAGGGSAASGGAGAGGSSTISTDPWPVSCVPAAYLSRPAGETLLTGPAGSSGFGDPAGPGEAMTATLNGFDRSFVRFALSPNGVTGYGFDGSLAMSLPSLASGTYACPDASIGYANLFAGGRDSNSAGAVDCCTIQITRSGAVGELIEGTFSGILVHQPLQSWIKVERGHFTVLRRGAGGAGGAGQGGAGGSG